VYVGPGAGVAGLGEGLMFIRVLSFKAVVRRGRVEHGGLLCSVFGDGPVCSW